ncbi:MAG TPA: polysaccharide deacetylase family protein [Terriglobales bacterium]|nr:polysaccharide deacetylase family protein [Terriglobales bacterium]
MSSAARSAKNPDAHQNGVVFLMYHELELPGRSLCQAEAGYSRYVVHEAQFRSQIRWLHEARWRGLSVSEALAFGPWNSRETESVAVTFDDGCESDLIIAAPVLKEAGCNATFYITVSYIGQRGYMSAIQLRELSAFGFEIGCHSMTHAYLTDLDERALQVEIGESKVELEEILGKPVEHFSCPGGRCDARVIQFARRAGYNSVANSHVHQNRPAMNRFDLGRIAILRETELPPFQEICRGEGLWKIQVRERLRSAAKQVLGNSLYDRGREFLLR